MKQKFANALSLALIVAMLFTSAALADTIQSDGDVVAPNTQTSVNLGTVAAGATLTPKVSFQLSCAGNRHVDSGQSVILTYNAGNSTIPAGGTLSATTAAIGAISSSWPDDGNNDCTGFSPVNDNGDSTVTIVAPTAGGTYSFVVAYGAALSPAGANDPASITGSVPTVTYILTVPSDTTAPVITPSISGTLGNNGWYTSDVTVSWSVVDNESAISASSGCDPTTINADTAITGTTLTCTATSAGGPSTQSVTIKRDATAPTISGSASPAANGAGWNNSDVAVSFLCNDGLSGIASCGPNTTLSTEVMGQSVTGTAVDNAGNSASTSVGPIRIDKTAPTISASISPSPAGTGWYNSTTGAPTVSFSCNDTGGSGLASSCPSAVTLGEGADQTVSGGPVSDVAGNTSTVATLSNIDVDLTAPSVALVGGPANGGSYYFGSVPAVPTCSASDGLSGLAGTCSVSGYGTTVGTHTVTASATDNAGNSASASATYTVLAWTHNGFFQPVDMGGVWNTVKGGSTVPLKFEVFAGSTELTDTSIVSAFSKQVACGTAGLEDTIEVLATGGTSLRYDWTAGQFVYNWQTPRLPGKCYAVTMTTQDGTTLTANFKLK